MMVEADHDLRNPADFLVLDKLAKGCSAFPESPGCRPSPGPRARRWSTRRSRSAQHAKRRAGADDEVSKGPHGRHGQAGRRARRHDRIGCGACTTSCMQLTSTTHKMIGETQEMQAVTEELRDDIADFEDFCRPVRSYFYWEKHCYDIPVCWSLRSVFDAIDGVDEISEKFRVLANRLRSARRADAAADRAVPADDRQHGIHAHDDADHAQHHVRHLRSDGRKSSNATRHGQGFRRREK